MLVRDDSPLAKPHARPMARGHRHGSGKHRRVVDGLRLQTLLGTDGGAKLPVDCRLPTPAADGVDKNRRLRAMLPTAAARGFAPGSVCSDSWYSGLDTLKAVRAHGWRRQRYGFSPSEPHEKPSCPSPSASTNP